MKKEDETLIYTFYVNNLKFNINVFDVLNWCINNDDDIIHERWKLHNLSF